MARITRQTTVNFDDTIFDAFIAWCSTVYPELTPQAALRGGLREAALAYMGTEPMEAARAAARRAAWLHAKIQITEAVAAMMRQAAVLLEQQAGQANAELVGIERAA